MIEEQRAHFESDAPIAPPAIRIERKRLESNPRRVNEYVLPLDAAWEFPRENLELGKVSNKLDVSDQNLYLACILCRFWVWETLAR